MGPTATDAAGARWPSVTLAEVLPLADAYRAARKCANAMDGEKTAPRREVRQAVALPLRAVKATFALAVGSDDPMRERLVQSWAEHFTVRLRNQVEQALPGALVEETIRTNLMRPFGVMWRGVMTHPAMPVYLHLFSASGSGSR